jgi:RNA polymerase sigma-B factor
MARKRASYRLTKIQQKLAEDNLNLARREAWRYHRTTGIQYTILESVAFEGLCQASAKYDPKLINEETGRPMRFSSLAVPYIRGSILHYIRDKTYALRLSHKMRENWLKGRRLLCQGETDIEIAKALEISIEEWRDTRSACSGPPLELLDQAVPTESLEPEEENISIVYAELAAELVCRGLSEGMEKQLKHLDAFFSGRACKNAQKYFNDLVALKPVSGYH